MNRYEKVIDAVGIYGGEFHVMFNGYIITEEGNYYSLCIPHSNLFQRIKQEMVSVQDLVSIGDTRDGHKYSPYVGATLEKLDSMLARKNIIRLLITNPNAVRCLDS